MRKLNLPNVILPKNELQIAFTEQEVAKILLYLDGPEWDMLAPGQGEDLACTFDKFISILSDFAYRNIKPAAEGDDWLNKGEGNFDV